VTAARLATGERALILNGSGGVGTAAIQIARALGAEVDATCSPANADRVRALGAHPLDRHAPLPTDTFDVALVAIGGDGVEQALAATVRGGRIAAIVGDLPDYAAAYGPHLGALAAGLGMLHHRALGAWRGRAVTHVVRPPDGATLARLTALVDAGQLRPVISARYPLERTADAHRAIEAGHTFGKLVIDVAPPR
jgi:NADPH:quinone reductase-like Zn-dependent oxidoreductase